MRIGGTLSLKASLILSCFSSPFVLAESLEGLTRLQKQASQIVKEHQSTGSSLEALDYLIGKFSRSSTGGPALWKIDFNSIHAPKPRIVVSDPLVDPNSSLIPRWVIRQQLDSVSGTCVPISPLRLDFSSDPSCSNSEITVDTSTLSGIENENSLPPEAEQIGVIGVLNLTEEDKKELLSNPAFIPEKSSDKIQPLIVRFKKLVLGEDSYILTIDVAGISVDLPIRESGSILCGFPQEDNPSCLESRPAKLCGCYDHSEAMQAGRGKLKDGTEIELVDAARGSGFKVWKEKNGNRILKSTGLWASPDDWQKKLYASGLFGVENTQFSTAEIETFAGRACPANTFQDEANRFDTEGCVYFDGLTSNQALRAAWNHPETVRAAASAWFDQNHQICADRGKRLPTLYEFQTESPPAKLPVSDGQPAFSSLSGIHVRQDAIWTATSAPYSNDRTIKESYVTLCGSGRFRRRCTKTRTTHISDPVLDEFWRFSHLGLNHASFSTPSQVMCVLPSNPQTRNICIANASGGTTTEISQNLFSRFRIHTFSTVGTDQFRVIDNCPMEVLVVAGGGGAGSGRAAGGGGGGGVLHRPNFNFPSMGQYPIKVGAGGGARTQGQNSSVSNLLIAIGGGRGGNGEGWANKEGGSGGSGGGGGFKGGWGAGAGTAGQGHNGGNNRWGNWIAGGGGGGAGGGGHGGHGNNRGSGGPGGWGRAFNMRGTTEYFGGGGGGRGQHDASSGGAGGGGSGGREASGTHGAAATGGGGGGSDGSGGSGVVIIKYQIQ